MSFLSCCFGRKTDDVDEPVNEGQERGRPRYIGEGLFDDEEDDEEEEEVEDDEEDSLLYTRRPSSSKSYGSMSTTKPIARRASTPAPTERTKLLKGAYAACAQSDPVDEQPHLQSNSFYYTPPPPMNATSTEDGEFQAPPSILLPSRTWYNYLWTFRKRKSVRFSGVHSLINYFRLDQEPIGVLEPYDYVSHRPTPQQQRTYTFYTRSFFFEVPPSSNLPRRQSRMLLNPNRPENRLLYSSAPTRF